MKTPIDDFVKKYIEQNPLRLHMPGHKGKADMGADITEVGGADSLYEAAGIILESEQTAGTLFGCRTFYSTEGSSHCIRAMLQLACLHAAEAERRPVVLAGRNAHRAFITAAALLDFDLHWLYGKDEGYLSCNIDARVVETAILETHPTALYLTSPDYLGNRTDIASIAAVCRKHGVLLLVDNAHGAYLKFLPERLHPMDLGADMCCDSAHKTLPVLTGGAYLHIRPDAPAMLAGEARRALGLFGSTSPSYLILRSLDRANLYLSAHRERLSAFLPKVEACRKMLEKQGFCMIGDEPLKLTVNAKKAGYSGIALAQILEKKNIVCEFADPDYLVLMVTPETGEEGLRCLVDAFSAVERRPEIDLRPPMPGRAERVCSVRTAMFSPREEIATEEAEGRILAAENMGCPPAVPILVAGERIDKAACKCFEYYGIESVAVLR